MERDLSAERIRLVLFVASFSVTEIMNSDSTVNRGPSGRVSIMIITRFPGAVGPGAVVFGRFRQDIPKSRE
jgi:hypothetical protein